MLDVSEQLINLLKVLSLIKDLGSAVIESAKRDEKLHKSKDRVKDKGRIR